MSTALGLLLFIGIVALAFGLAVSLIGSSGEEKRRLRAEHESRRFARQPWDNAGGRSNR